MTRVFMCGEMFTSPRTSGFTAASHALARPVAVVYRHSEAFERLATLARSMTGVKPNPR